MALLLASLYACNVCSIELKSRLWLPKFNRRFGGSVCITVLLHQVLASVKWQGYSCNQFEFLFLIAKIITDLAVFYILYLI